MKKIKLVNKVNKKRSDKKCYFCDEKDYDLLDLHRIKEGSNGGRYTNHNTLTICCKCHRKIHAGKIKIHGKHYSTSGRFVVHYTNEKGEEVWL